jgi:glyceraldehyde 3-phosphate dehydrogenase
VRAVNHPDGAASAAYLFKHDSIYGLYPGDVKAKENSLVIDGKEILVLRERDPTKLPWKKLGVDVVVESTGAFTRKEGASKHLIAGAKYVVVSAPSKDIEKTIILGVNDRDFNPKKDFVVSLGSCTTNCLAPLLAVIHQQFGIERAFYNTIHAFTNDQRLHDSPHSKLRRGRSASQNMVPTNSGANVSVVQAIPALDGKLNGLAIRVPVICGSLVDVTAELKKKFEVEDINAALKKAASSGAMKGILAYSEEELVSTDIVGDTHSSIVDGLSTMKDGNLVKVISWYDNEYGYSNRLVDFVLRL